MVKVTFIPTANVTKFVEECNAKIRGGLFTSNRGGTYLERMLGSGVQVLTLGEVLENDRVLLA